MLDFSKQNKLKNIYKEIFYGFQNYNQCKWQILKNALVKILKNCMGDFKISYLFFTIGLIMLNLANV